jgi:hypothetical protein
MMRRGRRGAPVMMAYICMYWLHCCAGFIAAM